MITPGEMWGIVLPQCAFVFAVEGMYMLAILFMILSILIGIHE